MKSTPEKLAYITDWQKKNWSRVLEYKRRWRARHRKQNRLCQKHYYDNNKEKINSWGLDWKRRNKDKVRSYSRNHAQKYPERIKLRKQRYARNNRQRVRDRINQKRTSDIQFRLTHCMRSRMQSAVRRMKAQKFSNTETLLGAPISVVKKHLESLWKPGMNWENHGYRGWHIDHIRPCASFDLKDPIQQLACFNYKNLQPLWGIDNFRKHDKLLSEL